MNNETSLVKENILSISNRMNQNDIVEVSRICKQCNIAKSINDFYKIYNGDHASKCKMCTINNMERRSENIDFRKNQKILMAEGKRQCTKCKEVKDISAYTMCRNTPSSYCKICYRNFAKENHKQYYITKVTDFMKQQKLLMDEGKHQCTKCNEVKDLSEYYIIRNKHSSYCKQCYCNNAKVYHKQNYVAKHIPRDECGVPIDKRDKLIDLYKNSTLSLGEIAKEIGVSATTLHAWDIQGIFNGIERKASTLTYVRAKQKALKAEGKRLCRTCNEVKLLSDFYRNTLRYLSYCKTCLNAPKKPLHAIVECDKSQQACVEIVNMHSTNITQ
jgi:transposase-like protein